MKKQILSIVITIAISSFTAYSQTDSLGVQQQTVAVVSKSDVYTFNVQGNCGMCKNRIETAAKSVDGVLSATWNSATKIIEVEVVAGTDIHKVHMAIAQAGHDTEMHTASDEAYGSLPGCCKYR